MWVHYYTYLFSYGILLTLLSLGFYLYKTVNSSIKTNSVKQLFKLVFSICSGWLLVINTLGANGLEPAPNKFIDILYTLKMWVFPMIFFIGLEMIIYGFFNDEN
jgi:hypothetical protein